MSASSKSSRARKLCTVAVTFMRNLRGPNRHLTLSPAGKEGALSVYPYFKVREKSGQSRTVLEEQPGTSTCRSSELCKIDYFLIAHNLKMMLYLQRSQINVPRDRPLGKLFPPSSCSRRFDRKHEMRRFLKELGTASRYTFKVYEK